MPIHTHPNHARAAAAVPIGTFLSKLQLLSKQADLPFVSTKEELAKFLKCSPKHVEHLTSRRLLKPLRLGRCVRYRRDSVIRALEQMEVSHK